MTVSLIRLSEPAHTAPHQDQPCADADNADARGAPTASRVVDPPTRNWADAVSATRRGGEGRGIVAGDLPSPGGRDLHLGLPCSVPGRDRVQRLRPRIRSSSRWAHCSKARSSVSRSGCRCCCDDNRDRRLLAGPRPLPESTPSRPAMLSCGLTGDLQRHRGVGGGVLGRGLDREPDSGWRRWCSAAGTLSFTVLDWPASIGIELSSWLPYCSVKLVSKFFGACAPRLITEIAAAVVLDFHLEFKARLRCAAQRREAAP